MVQSVTQANRADRRHGVQAAAAPLWALTATRLLPLYLEYHREPLGHYPDHNRILYSLVDLNVKSAPIIRHGRNRATLPKSDHLLVFFPRRPVLEALAAGRFWGLSKYSSALLLACASGSLDDAPWRASMATSSAARSQTFLRTDQSSGGGMSPASTSLSSVVGDTPM